MKLKMAFLKFKMKVHKLSLYCLVQEAVKKVLDYCAGKGTKTIALFEQMKGIGAMYAFDENLQRLNFLKERG